MRFIRVLTTLCNIGYRIAVLSLLALIVFGQYANQNLTPVTKEEAESKKFNQPVQQNVLEPIVYKANSSTPKLVKVFTYFNCAHCRRLHSMIPEINKLGFDVEYLPISNTKSETDRVELAKLACAPDKMKAIDELYTHGHVLSYSDVSCGINPFLATDVSASLKVTGTPSFLVEVNGKPEIISGLGSFLNYAKSSM